jgi:c-di-GMP-binding flagellar brake protein YcgR
MEPIKVNSGADALVSWHGGRDRRANPRLQCWGTAGINVLPDGSRIIGYLLDLSLGGCYVETDAAVEANLDASVEVLLYPEGYTLRLAGVVCHTEGGTRIGIRFADVSDRKAEQIRSLIELLNRVEKERLAGVEELGG